MVRLHNATQPITSSSYKLNLLSGCVCFSNLKIPIFTITRTNLLARSLSICLVIINSFDDLSERACHSKRLRAADLAEHPQGPWVLSLPSYIFNMV